MQWQGTHSKSLPPSSEQVSWDFLRIQSRLILSWIIFLFLCYFVISHVFLSFIDQGEALMNLSRRESSNDYNSWYWCIEHDIGVFNNEVYQFSNAKVSSWEQCGAGTQVQPNCAICSGFSKTVVKVFPGLCSSVRIGIPARLLWLLADFISLQLCNSQCLAASLRPAG